MERLAWVIVLGGIFFAAVFPYEFALLCLIVAVVYGARETVKRRR